MNLQRHLRWTGLSAISGVLSGGAAAVFLILLDLATRFREAHLGIVWFLPLAGLAIGWIYYRHGQDVAGGNNLILDEIHDPKKVTPARMAPFILVGTILTHLFGGSAGREGTAVQMGASLSDQLSRFFRIEPEERKILLTTGAGAGFGAAIGAPWAGVIFGLEVIEIGRLRVFALFECLIASFVAYGTTFLLHAPHSRYPGIVLPSFEWRTLLLVALAGAAFGLAARGFILLTHWIERLQSRIAFPPFKPLIAGVVLVALYWLEGSYQYAGLGISVIQDALKEPTGFKEPVLKTLFTAITVGSGFKGGEFIPLVFNGTTLGSALGALLSVPFSLLAAVGFAAVFGAAANTPIACSIMAVEVFGIGIAPYAFVACLMGYYFSGHHGIYRSQKIYLRKHQRLMAALVWTGDLPKRFLNGKKARSLH